MTATSDPPRRRPTRLRAGSTAPGMAAAEPDLAGSARATSAAIGIGAAGGPVASSPCRCTLDPASRVASIVTGGAGVGPLNL